MSHWSTNDETVLGVLFYVEKADGFLGMLVARDKYLRYRPFGNAVPFRTKREGESSIRARLSELERQETPVPTVKASDNPGVDLFSVKHDGELSPVFLNMGVS